MISNLVSARHSFGRFRPLKPAVNVETAFKVLRTGSTTFLALVPLPANRSASRTLISSFQSLPLPFASAHCRTVLPQDLPQNAQAFASLGHWIICQYTS